MERTVTDPSNLYNLHNGVFTIGTGAAGAPLLRAFLSADAVTSHVHGSAVYSKVENPPVVFNSVLDGVWHATGLGGTAQVFALKGVAQPPLPGAKHIVNLSISLSEVWGKQGTATYSYYDDTAKLKTVENQPVEVQWLLLASKG